MTMHSLGTLWRLAPAALALLAQVCTNPVYAEVQLPALFTDHMVLQRGVPCPVWGTAAPGEEVTVSFAGQQKSTKADSKGAWSVTLDPLKAPGGGKLTISAGNQVVVDDVAVGEVWICSGQSNMEWPVARAFNAELELAAANRPDIRLLTVRQVGTQTPQADFPGQWEPATPEAVRDFSAVGYLFGLRLQETLGVPVGLIDNAWGGSACEAWVPRERFEGEDLYAPLLKRWAETEAKYDEASVRSEHEQRLASWREKASSAKAAGQRPAEPPMSNHELLNQHRPANLYNARVAPLVPFAIRGAIWYQGETNAGRAQQYRDLFPRMISAWRDAWGQADLPFYWVQLADFQAESTGPQESDWAELREAQTMTLDRLPHTGEAVIIDLGDGRDIHPRNKQEVANRLARLALAKDYGRKLASDSPRFKELKVTDGKAVVTFGSVGRGLTQLDANEVQGFTIAGADQKWVDAQAKITGPDKVEVWSDQVAEPVAVRYAWANNPVCNLYSDEGLPVTPFRTDVWPGVTDGKR